MPHFIVEYSANLDGRADIQTLCEAIREQALQTGFFEIGAIRVRAISCKNFAIADLDERNAFVHIKLRMGAGRSLDDKRSIGEAIFATASKQLKPLLDEPYFGLSFDIQEIDPQLSWKKNAMHPRLRGA
ncbi:MAG: 5-carboxymethyl-2-hydroxymuconate Delta-isomerase [Rhizobiaceae bacterium]|nr:5-carboxymethyl-2-hydroxymuconate Delta-isomerase [Rhizobiaceae bacterium]MBL4733587.1 5-carboxymethyl-2-hydroxymuconate Delta-isomerase [Rhizobiaceae bacterium]